MNIETDTIDAADKQAQGIKPYHTFRFRDYPFRWIAVFILWNIGHILECPRRLSWPWIYFCHSFAWFFTYLHCPTFARWIWGYQARIEYDVFKAEKELQKLQKLQKASA